MQPKRVVLEYQGCDGLFPDEDDVELCTETVQATPGVIARLRVVGSQITSVPTPSGSSDVWNIVLGRRMPPGIVAVPLPQWPWIGLRLDTDPPYPGESPDTWLQAGWLPCPKCGAPVVWYEAGYVRGYRVCARPPYHHLMVKLQ